MIKDVRRLCVNEALLILRKVSHISDLRNSNVRFDDLDNDWHVEVRMKDRSVFKGYGRGNINDGVVDSLNIEYSPPNSGSIVFVLKIEPREHSGKERDSVKTEILALFNSFLANHGGKGMNFVSNFEDLEIYKTNDFSMYPKEFVKAKFSKRNALQIFGLWVLKIANNF